jgi:hypothetical protein
MEVSGQLYVLLALLLGKKPGTHWKRGWVGPRANMDTVVKEKHPCPCQKLNSGCPAHSLIIILNAI